MDFGTNHRAKECVKKIEWDKLRKHSLLWPLVHVPYYANDNHYETQYKQCGAKTRAAQMAVNCYYGYTSDHQNYS